MPINSMQVNPVNILTSYMPEAMTSALAFMQAFYPPIPIEMENDPSDLSANGTLIGYPGGWQYPLVESFTPNDPYSIFISGAANCLTGDVARNNWLMSDYAQMIYNESLVLYQTIGSNFLPTRLKLADMNFYNAWSIYDALDYLNRHSPWVQENFGATGPYDGDLTWLANLASQQMWEFYGTYNSSKSIYNNYFTTAGSTLAGAVYMYFNQMLETGGEYQKFNLIIADFEPIISMLALMGMGDVEDDYRVLPPYSTSLVFELFTYDAPGTVVAMPPPEDMFVRFYFRNGTAPGTEDPSFWALPMFGNGPSQTDMTWPQFAAALADIAFIDPLDWCNTCDSGAINAWCAGFDSWVGGNGQPTTPKPKKSGGGGVSAPVAGVIGALVTLVVAGLIFAIGALLCGFRIHKREGPSRASGIVSGLYPTGKSTLGGFKGSAKMASDADLHLPPNAAPPAAGAYFEDKDLESKRPRGHERVGSWELHGGKDLDQSGHQRFQSVGSTIIGAHGLDRSSFDGDNFIDVVPVKPRESF
jgi:hypothetical protein